MEVIHRNLFNPYMCGKTDAKQDMMIMMMIIYKWNCFIYWFNIQFLIIFCHIDIFRRTGCFILYWIVLVVYHIKKEQKFINKYRADDCGISVYFPEFMLPSVMSGIKALRRNIYLFWTDCSIFRYQDMHD